MIFARRPSSRGTILQLGDISISHDFFEWPFQIPEESRGCHQPPCNGISVDVDRVTRVIKPGAHAECPKHASNGDEQASLGDVKSRADSSTRTKIEVRPFGRVGTDAEKFARRLFAVVTGRVEIPGIVKSRRIIVDGPHLPDKTTLLDMLLTNRGLP